MLKIYYRGILRLNTIKYVFSIILCFVGITSSAINLFDTIPAAPTGKKWHPGHYALVYDSRFLSMVDNPALIAEFETWVSKLPHEIRGIQGGAYWCNLETAKGVYDFRLIDIQIKICERYGKQLFCTISEKQFNMPWSPAPEYISSEYDGIAIMTPSSGQSARIWDKRVLERFCLLIDTLGARYDSNPTFEGIEFMETSFSCDPAIEKARGFCVNDYIHAYQTLLKRAKGVFRKSVIIQEINYLPSSGAADEIKMSEFIAFCSDLGVGIGGPDLFSDKQRDTKKNRIPSYEYFPLYAGQIPLASDVQYPEYACSMWYHGKYTSFGNFTPKGLLDMGINTLKLNYIFWCAVEKTPEVRFGFSTDVITTLQRKNWPIHTGWPNRL